MTFSAACSSASLISGLATGMFGRRSLLAMFARLRRVGAAFRSFQEIGAEPVDVFDRDFAHAAVLPAERVFVGGHGTARAAVQSQPHDFQALAERCVKV